jgi:16S rRNA (guanine527-N7)-methyltransferase
VLDSIAFLQAFDLLPELRTVKRIADMGTGGGFPLLPLALCLPEVQCFGIDSTQKKISAISRIVETMNIKNITLHAGRLEDFGHDKNVRGTMDLVTARALAELPILLEYGIPLLKVGGLCAFWKSSKVADELASTAYAQKVLSAPFVRIFDYDLGDAFGKRCIVFFRKIAETRSLYPRKVGEPKMKPL